MTTNDKYLPSYEELTVPQEMVVSSPALRAGVFHLGKYCEMESKEFILCRNEYEDPRKCLAEGRHVTACGVRFFQHVKKLCADSFTDYMNCVDNSSEKLLLAPCRRFQRVFDRCMLDNMNIERPRIGYYSVPHIHKTQRPPVDKQDFPDYKSEADKVIKELPENYPIRKDYKRFYQPQVNPFI
ncbi:unnamed protein product [Soboliphyme baturini]|uniref:NADH dehydrogenase [ubiquinone] 1 alpha subcomplex subunit 8 n=1 Tax=Soboliphyme baturini TaxID=241478 RepID=A0A183IGI6_9BILA|nr:unnamed protein product [Soboliphyme baturini]